MLGDSVKMLALGLSSLKNLCVNSDVVSAENMDYIDAACRKLTANWVRVLASDNPNVNRCDFFKRLENAGSDALLPPGVYTLQEGLWKRERVVSVLLSKAYGAVRKCDCLWLLVHA